jgi:hypothetical protein
MAESHGGESMSLARKMKRRDVISKSEQQRWMAQGQLKGVQTMTRETEARLTEAYNIGFNEASMKAHVFIATIAVSVLHDKFGFGKDRAKKFSEYLDERTGLVNSGKLSMVDIVGELANEKLGFLLESQVDDGAGHIYKVDWRKMVAEEAERQAKLNAECVSESSVC